MKQLWCKLNKKWLYIGLGAGGGLVLLIIAICCCYCCCCRGSKKGEMKEWMKWEKMRANRTAQREEQRRDRQVRMDDIRRKYGIEDSRRYDRNITK